MLERGAHEVTLRFVRWLPHPPVKVWRALAEPEHLAAWFPTTVEGELAAGSELRFRFREVKAPPFEGRMLAFDPPALMELMWGDERLRFELATAPWPQNQRWSAVHGEYVTRFGPDAAIVGPPAELADTYRAATGTDC